jgi:hypothetical protein
VNRRSTDDRETVPAQPSPEALALARRLESLRTNLAVMAAVIGVGK